MAGYPLPADRLLEIDQIEDEYLRAELEKREWQKAFVGQSGQLEIANGRTEDVIFIVRRCEELANEARDRSGRKWWQFWR